MSSDTEAFLCMVQRTEYISNLLFHSGKLVEKYETEINILFGEEKFRNIKEIVELNNTHINTAIKELLKNQDEINILLEDTGITKEEIEEIKQLLK